MNTKIGRFKCIYKKANKMVGRRIDWHKRELVTNNFQTIKYLSVVQKINCHLKNVKKDNGEIHRGDGGIPYAIGSSPVAKKWEIHKEV